MTSPGRSKLLTIVASAAALGLAGVASASHSLIDTAAGTGTAGFAGDGGPAVAADLNLPADVAPLPGGGYLIADRSNHRVRRVAADGTITTLAGTGTPGYSGDGSAASTARLQRPSSVAPTADGGYLIADTSNHRIRRVSAGGTITTVAGTGNAGLSGDGGPATSAQLSSPGGVAATPDGGYLIADTGNSVVRLVTPGGTILTVAGSTSPGFGGDGGFATSARLRAPNDVAPTADFFGPGLDDVGPDAGGFLIADTGNDRIREVDGSGRIATVAGGGIGGDGGLATAAALSSPHGVATLAGGGFVLADTGNQRARTVSSAGTISTLAGTGTAGFSGDGGLPEQASLSRPWATVPEGAGFLIADSGNNRVRRIAPAAHDVPAADERPGEGGGPQGDPSLRPVIRKLAVARPFRGRTLIRRPGSRRYVLLRSTARIPIGSTLETRRGAIRITVASDVHGGTATVEAAHGRFRIAQGSGDAPMATLRLNAPLDRCPPARRGRSSRTATASGHAQSARHRSAKRKRATRRRSAKRKRRSRRSRKLWVKGKGRFRTRGRYASATVRGTRWLTADSCTRTVIRVRTGAVAVRDVKRRRTRVVPAGRRLTIKRPAPRRR